MVAQCANPGCQREFPELSQGRLFLLPPTDDCSHTWRGQRLIDHCYWLCPNCATTHTIELEGTRPVVRKQQRAPDQATGASLGASRAARGTKAG